MGTVVALRMTGVAEQDGVSEALLVRQARNGDATSFESLYRRHEGRVYALCLRMTRSPERAEDCTQETFVKAWRSLPAFEGRSAFGTWLHRIAVNQVLSLQRKEARGPGFLELVEDRPGPTEVRPKGRDAGVEMDLEQAIGSLPKGARNVFVLYAIHGYSHEETADMLGVAVGTCKAQLHRARKLLADRLDL